MPAHVRGRWLVTETRRVTYPYRSKAWRLRKKGKPKRGTKKKWVADAGGTGREIVHERLVCAECAGTAP